MLLTVAIGILAMFVAVIISILFVYQRKTYEHKKKVTAIEETLKQEILKTQIEVQDQTLTYISREIHDNITQVLSFVKLSLGVKNNDPVKVQQKIDESRELLAQTINDLRDLSKSLSFDTIKALGLADTIRFEVDRINKSDLVKMDYAIIGEPYELSEQQELILFRIFQESVNNALKHAEASVIKVEISYLPEIFKLSVADNGKGFPIEILNEHRGSGLQNLQNRGKLVGADVMIDSIPAKGCQVAVSLPIDIKNFHDESKVSDSIS